MKNGKHITAWLDECAALLEMGRSQDIAVLEALHTRLTDDRSGALWKDLLADGWTITELDDAYERRFNFRAER